MMTRREAGSWRLQFGTAGWEYQLVRTNYANRCTITATIRRCAVTLVIPVKESRDIAGARTGTGGTGAVEHVWQFDLFEAAAFSVGNDDIRHATHWHCIQGFGAGQWIFDANIPQGVHRIWERVTNRNRNKRSAVAIFSDGQLARCLLLRPALI